MKTSALFGNKIEAWRPATSLNRDPGADVFQ